MYCSTRQFYIFPKNFSTVILLLNFLAAFFSPSSHANSAYTFQNAKKNSFFLSLSSTYDFRHRFTVVFMFLFRVSVRPLRVFIKKKKKKKRVRKRFRKRFDRNEKKSFNCEATPNYLYETFGRRFTDRKNRPKNNFSM